MKLLKYIQSIGLVGFIAAILFWIAILFIGQFNLNSNQLQKQLFWTDDVKHQALAKEIGNQVPSKTLNKFEALALIDKAINEANKTVENHLGIDINSIANLVELHKQGDQYIYQTDKNSGLNSLSAEQTKTLSDYTNWMNGQSFSKDELSQKLNETIQQINNSAANNYGFNSYSSKELKANILKFSEVSFINLYKNLVFALLILGTCLFALMYISPQIVFLGKPGIKNNGIFQSAMHSRGWLGIATGTLLILFYIALYWFHYYLAEWLIITESFSQWISGGSSSQWFVYGLLYTIAILVMGIRMFIKYRHSKYHLVRTASIMFFQLAFAFIVPHILAKNSLPSIDLKNMWPLDYTFFFEYRLDELAAAGTLGYFMLGWGIVLFLIAVPLFTYLYGKRWYCSWVCGCGGLAETLGDPYRQLSDKSMKAWKVERWMIHSVLVFAVVMTVGVLYTYFTGSSQLMGINTYELRSWYGFFIGAGFSGVVGTGFYPLMGNRTWCRFGCPLAAYLGIIQRFKSRFRITTNGGQCISCGNCSTYCEMGIDVRSYAQKGENIVRSSCVGCGVCAAVCPRGVLKLENAEEESRIHGPIEISDKGITVLN